MYTDTLQIVKNRKWFYEFELPDGTKTQTDIPVPVRQIHASRLGKLQEVIKNYVGDSKGMSAVDFASHEGYFSIELSKHFDSVLGLEIRQESMDAAQQITSVMGRNNITYQHADLQKMEFDPKLMADFVLCYGLLYHVENPIHVIRLASQMSRKHILIETQIFPFDITGPIEDGHYEWQRNVEGVFSLSIDYAARREGGSTDIAMIPSLNALVFLLKNFGFKTVEVMRFDVHEYEQFRRGSRVVVYGQK
jgi:ubiquinone/menaquinone biosynthesis C-methylase UbiE